MIFKTEFCEVPFSSLNELILNESLISLNGPYTFQFHHRQLLKNLPVIFHISFVRILKLICKSITK